MWFIGALFLLLILLVSLTRSEGGKRKMMKMKKKKTTTTKETKRKRSSQERTNTTNDWDDPRLVPLGLFLNQQSWPIGDILYSAVDIMSVEVYYSNDMNPVGVDPLYLRWIVTDPDSTMTVVAQYRKINRFTGATSDTYTTHSTVAPRTLLAQARAHSGDTEGYNAAILFLHWVDGRVVANVWRGLAERPSRVYIDLFRYPLPTTSGGTKAAECTQSDTFQLVVSQEVKMPPPYLSDITVRPFFLGFITDPHLWNVTKLEGRDARTRTVPVIVVDANTSYNNLKIESVVYGTTVLELWMGRYQRLAVWYPRRPLRVGKYNEYIRYTCDGKEIRSS